MNKLFFLGTGAAASVTRRMTSILLSIDGRGILVDCGDGMGTVRQIVRSGVPLSTINDVFLTHKHADHIIGMPHFLFVKMIQDKEAKIRVFGSLQTVTAAKTISFLTHEYIRDNKHRVAFVPAPVGKSVKLFPGCAVIVAKMNHGTLSAYGYSFEVGEKKIVFSGDTGPCRALSKLSRGADILIHECFGLDKNRDEIHEGHSTARDAGELAEASGVKRLILTHFPKDTHTVTEALKAEARRYFRGDVMLAEDGMEIEM